MKGLLELIKLIFGPKALSKTIGTRTNVIRLPNNKIKRYTKSDLNIEAASDAAAMNAKKEMEELIAEVPKMNDAERLIFEGNLRRLKNRLGIRSETDPTADVFQFGTKEKITPGGIASLTEKAGQKSPPGTLMGNIESRIKQLEASGEDLSTMKGQTLDEIMGDVASSQQGMRQLEKQGLVRATARDIITSDIKSGKLKLPKELEKQILEGGGEPIDILRNVYGEDALEVLDSLIPEFSKLRTSTEAEKLARSKFKFEPDVNRPKGSMSLEEAKKAEQENILTPKKPEEPEEFATGGRVGMAAGGVIKLVKKAMEFFNDSNPMSAYKKYLKYVKETAQKDPAKLAPEVGGIVVGSELIHRGLRRKLKEAKEKNDTDDTTMEDRAEKSSGGISQGLDYLMGIERRGYAEGTDPSLEALKLLLLQNSGGGSDSGPTFTTPTKEESEATLTEGMTDVGENKGIGSLGSMIMGGLISAINPVLGIAYSLADPNSMTRQVLGKIGFNPTTQGSISSTDGPFGGYGGFDGTEGSFGSVDTQAQSEASMSEGMSDVGDSSGGVDSAGDGGDGYATGGLVNRTGFKFGTKFGRFWKIARKVWDDINPTGDRKYDAQLVADELAEQIFKTSMDDLPQNVQIDLYALAYNNAPKVDALFTNPQSLSEAAKKGMAASKEMESLGLDVTKNSDFFKYEEMKLSGQLGPEHQVQAYKDKIRDEFYGVIDDTLMKQVEVDDNPQRLAEVYASIKEGLTMQKKGMTPEEIVRIMKQTPRTKNSQGGLNYLMGY